MAAEIEVKFLSVDVEDIRAKLVDNGAILEQPMRLMRRDLFDYTDPERKLSQRRARLRVRDEGDKLTVTFKQPQADSEYADEIETTIESYDAMKALFEAVGLKSYTYQESRRETWHLDDVEVVIDEWPWIKPYIEIEGPSEAVIQTAAAKLGFDWRDAQYGSVETAYRAEYPKLTEAEDVGAIPVIKFDIELPQFLAERR